MTEIKLPFINGGKEFELPKLPVGGTLALAKYRSEFPDYTAEEAKKMLFDDRQIQQLKILVAWSIKNRFEDLDVGWIMDKMDAHCDLKEIVELGSKVMKQNFPEGEGSKRDRPKDEAEKK